MVSSVSDEKLVHNVQLVVVSPLMRACETAAAVFGETCSDASEASLLMKQQSKIPEERAAHAAITLPTGVRFVGHEFAREQVCE
ncbi:g6970 [Coccomyxa viridis]|uniref:G6970 protein n=1 Tax=Coccomyxa viridis TaxID=1274662 RepID=A0ABP1FWM6_9CHLO